MIRTDDLKTGTLVGQDKYGNRYYENNMYFVGEFIVNNGSLSGAIMNLYLYEE